MDTNKTTNLALELDNILNGSSNTDSSEGIIKCLYSLSNSTSILSAPTIPPEFTYVLDSSSEAYKSTQSLTSKLADHFSCLNLNDPASTKPNPSLALTNELELELAFTADLVLLELQPVFEEALSGPEVHIWWEAMVKGVSTFQKLDTCELTDLPSGWKVIGNKWVLTKKLDMNGTPIKHKACLVAVMTHRP
ncbi:hypothetical protein OPQ81_011094 [Rhizoctonia solani]|nr:hypothetical protein OPQ81_011094 [Rhizoctonia solani]